ncbi:heavy metal-associated isoprenylated plant protein 41-like isoform X2 [Canna indica]|uniref:Heavy metal-associated isoprenylated plant protein 41-like isoform X2 n=1 Tax=Canna indica TaxID=4628 RepID=A0AAQ3JPU5_9LILI|nr:heavy metal-associated isoprenylated plant protein 41-like isoform X2 [Canna indica]
MEKPGASMAGIPDIGEEEDEAVGVKWLNHYSSLHRYCWLDALLQKYHKARLNLESLSKLGATTLHGVNAKTMKLHTDLKMR